MLDVRCEDEKAKAMMLIPARLKLVVGITVSAVAYLLLGGCQASGHARGGGTSVEKITVAPTTRTTVIDAKGMPPEQWAVFAELWKTNPPQKGAK